MKIQLNIKFIFFIVFLISVLSLLMAIYIEKGLGYKPCSLCIYQRVPYMFAIFISFLGYYYNKNLIWMYLLLLTFIVSVALSGYHIGVENEIFSGLQSCVSNNSNITEKTEILESLQLSNVSCKEVEFKILGLSLATINFIISLIISAIIIFKINYEK